VHVAKKTNKSNAVGTQSFCCPFAKKQVFAVIHGFPTRNNISMFKYAFFAFLFFFFKQQSNEGWL
jgi:hypothetical protein